MRTTRYRVWGALLLSTIGLALPAQAKNPDPGETVVAGEVGRELERAIAKAQPDLWGSVLVAREGKILLAKGYGMADYDAESNRPNTLHEIASASKQVTATAILHLRQRKKLALTDTIDRFFKSVPEDKKGITIHHLLTHTSGISGNTGVSYGATLGRRAYVKQMLAKPLTAEPGERFEYCNAGYALLAAVVEEVTKSSFEKYVEKVLFKPAKMKDSGFIGDKDLQKSGRCSTRKGRTAGKTAADWFQGWGYRGMGGVVTTVHDLLLWDRALRSGKILKGDTLEVLYKPFKNRYACGWKVALTDRGGRKVHHSGGVEGYGCNVIRYLEDDICIFVLSNNGASAYAVSNAIENVLCKPVSLAVEIDVSTLGGGGRTVELPERLTWAVRRKKGMVLLQLEDKKRVILQIDVPQRTVGKKLAFELEQAIFSCEASDEEGMPALGGALYLSGYGPSAKIRHPFGSVEIQAEYRSKDAAGKPVIHRGVTLVLSDTRSGGRTGAVQMSLATATKLQKALRKFVK